MLKKAILDDQRETTLRIAPITKNFSVWMALCPESNPSYIELRKEKFSPTPLAKEIMT